MAGFVAQVRYTRPSKNGPPTGARGPVGSKPVKPPTGALGPAGGKYGPIPNPPKTHILNLQRFLNTKGYHVATDGIMGKQTRAAVADWHTGVNNRPLLNAHKQATKIVLDGRNTSKMAKTRVGGGGGGKAGGGSGGGNGGAGGTDSQYNLINPKTYAQSLADAQYDPVIEELTRQQTQATAQGRQSQLDVTGWINQLLDTQKGGAAANAAALAKGIQSNQSDIAGIEGLFGQSGGHDLATVAADNLANLRAGGKTTSDFDNHMAAVLQAQGVDQHMATQRSTDATLAGLASQIVSQKGAKGSAYTKAIQDAYGTRLQQQAAVQNMKLAGQLAPVQLATAKANLAGTKARLSIAEKQAAIAGRQAALQDKATRAQLDQFTKTQAGTTIPFNTLQAGDRLKLMAAITKGIRSNVLGSGHAGSATGNHKVWGAIKAMLSPYDTSDPGVRQFALGILRQLSSGFTPKNFK